MNILEKYAGYGALICMLAMASIYANQMRIKYNAEKERSKAFENTISGLNQKIDTFKVVMQDSISLYAARVENLKMTKKNIQDRYDDLLKSTKIKPKDVQGMVSVGKVTADTVRVPVEVDSFGGLKTGYKDKFTTINVNISKDRSAAIDYAIWDSISIINEQKKHSILFGLIKWKETERTTVVSHNPKSKIVGVTSIDIIK